MKIEEGRYYKTRDGRKVGPVTIDISEKESLRVRAPHLEAGFVAAWFEDGRFYEKPGSTYDIVALWNEGPVRTVTRKEIVPGEYGHILVDRTANDGSLVLLGFKSTGGIYPQVRSYFTSTELTAAIETLTTIRDALDEVAA